MLTLESIYRTTAQTYRLTLLAGEKGLFNSMGWVYMMEDKSNGRFLKEGDLIITTCMNYGGEEWLLHFIEILIEHQASGLILNTGKYIKTVPEVIMQYCEEQNFPLFSMPWEIHIAEIMRDYCNRLFAYEQREQSLKPAFSCALFHPEKLGAYREILEDGCFYMEEAYYVVVNDAWKVQKDAAFVEQWKRICKNCMNRVAEYYYMFYYEQKIIIIMKEIPIERMRAAAGWIERKLRLLDASIKTGTGIGSRAEGLVQLSKSYHRAEAALATARQKGAAVELFEEIGINQLLLSLNDSSILEEYCYRLLNPLLDYDGEVGGNYTETLKLYLEQDESVQKTADKLFMHRNTVNYRIRKIKEILNDELDTAEKRLPYQIAFKIQELLSINSADKSDK